MDSIMRLLPGPAVAPLRTICLARGSYVPACGRHTAPDDAGSRHVSNGKGASTERLNPAQGTAVGNTDVRAQQGPAFAPLLPAMPGCQAPIPQSRRADAGPVLPRLPPHTVRPEWCDTASSQCVGPAAPHQALLQGIPTRSRP